MKKKPNVLLACQKHQLPKEPIANSSRARIYVNNRQTALRLDAKGIRQLVKETVAREAFLCGEITIHFVGSRKISALHAEFFDDPSVTDCITFPLASPDPRLISGDVFVCPQTAIDYVQKQGGDALAETYLYVIHGLLHLMGYDDLNPKAKRAMRQAEKRHLTALPLTAIRRDNSCQN